MYDYYVEHIPLSQALQRPDIKMVPQYITIHSTANEKSTAKNERDNLARVGNNVQASFHLVVDERSVYECIPLNEVAWHAGDGRGVGNMSSIGIEICESGNRERTIENAAHLVAFLLHKLGWGIERVKQHYYWSGKNCPRILRSGELWQMFLIEVDRRRLELDKKFDDLSKERWSYNHILELINMGILNGTSSTTFEPDRPATREELAVAVRNTVRYITGK